MEPIDKNIFDFMIEQIDEWIKEGEEDSE